MAAKLLHQLMQHLTHGLQGPLATSFVSYGSFCNTRLCWVDHIFSCLSYLFWLTQFFKRYSRLRLQEQPLGEGGAWKLLLFVTHFSWSSFCGPQITFSTPVLLWWLPGRNSTEVSFTKYSFLLYTLHCTCLDKPQIAVFLQLSCKTMA